ncbi:MAG: hypothetical protein R6U63_09990 [Longimicrobiales bacterium]
MSADTAEDLPPTGYGSLRQDEFSVEIQTRTLHVKVTPLDEGIIRLAAPDTYNRLQALVRSRRSQALEMTERPEAELFLVSFFSRDPNVAYRPEELRITHRARSLQPVGIVPLTTGWGRQLLQPQRTQSAIYVFEPPFDYELPITIRYGMQENDDWHRVVLPRLEEERARVESRAGTRPTAGSRTP